MTTKGVELKDLHAWREDWLAAYGSSDGTDQVTPFDKYLYKAERVSDDPTVEQVDAYEALDTLCRYFHQRSVNAGWWLENKVLPSGHEELIDHSTYEDPFFIATKIALIHSEASEGLEGYRKDLPDDKLPHYPCLAVELADDLIRICDLGGRFGYRLGSIAREKDAFNAVRPDHKPEARMGKGGKKF